MAGRGTDIKLDDVAREAGGLKIIGTERHESRRIDNQLRGRSGRQGDPGESRFYISLEDDLMRLFGSERLMKIFTSLGVAENEQIEHKMLSNAIQKAQEKIEFNNFGIRKNLLDYDQVNNEQREIIYKERRQVLDGENMRDTIYKMITDIVDSTCLLYTSTYKRTGAVYNCPFFCMLRGRLYVQKESYETSSGSCCNYCDRSSWISAGQ